MGDIKKGSIVRLRRGKKIWVVDRVGAGEVRLRCPGTGNTRWFPERRVTLVGRSLQCG